MLSKSVMVFHLLDFLEEAAELYRLESNKEKDEEIERLKKEVDHWRGRYDSASNVAYPKSSWGSM